MNYVISEVGAKRKNTYPDMNPETGDPKTIALVNSRMLSVEKYHELARRVIGKWAPIDFKTSMLNSEDAIDFVAHKIMMGDWDYDSEKSSISTYRGYCGKCAIQDYISTLAEQRPVSTNFFGREDYEDIIIDFKTSPVDTVISSEEKRREYRQIILDKMKDVGLNETQKICMAMHHMENMSVNDIANELGITRQGVSKSLQEGAKKLKDV